MPTYTLHPMIGRVFTKIEVVESRYVKDGKEVRFWHGENSYFVMYHNQDCCEGVDLYDTVGDLEDLIGNPILMAEETTDETNPPPNRGDDSFTWTFYRFATIKGHVLLRWYGESNGYYSESVSIGAYTNEELMYLIEDGNLIMQGDHIQDADLPAGTPIAEIRTTATINRTLTGITVTTVTTSTSPPEVYFHRPDTVD